MENNPTIPEVEVAPIAEEVAPVVEEAPAVGEVATPPAEGKPEKKGKGAAVTGLVTSIIGLILSWIPIAGAILPLIGFICSIVALVRRRTNARFSALVLSLVGFFTCVVITIIVCYISMTFFTIESPHELLELYREIFV
ncbi:MAG: hypothetical protein LBL82_00060 [Oscillospiraceae bacterium]|jgi:thiol:disulfide interchange protein|nr:hypothetical protein [Oscillospiraceae bacterium]